MLVEPTMRRLLVVIASVAALVAAALAVSATSGSRPLFGGNSDPDPTMVRLPPVPGEPDPPDPGAAAAAAAPGPPTVSPADLAAAEAILASDERFRSLLGSIGYTVTASLPWSRSRLTELELTLSRPWTAPDTMLPGARFHEDDLSYDELELHLAARDVTTLRVLVDQTAGTVISIDPLDGVVTELPGNQHFPSDD
jgi:hypothetical protein